MYVYVVESVERGKALSSVMGVCTSKKSAKRHIEEFIEAHQESFPQSAAPALFITRHTLVVD